jgi:hypothetical protein
MWNHQCLIIPLLATRGSIRRRSWTSPRRQQTLEAAIRIPIRAVTSPQLRRPMIKRLMSRNHPSSFPQPQSQLPAPGPSSHRHPAGVPEAAVAALGRFGTNLEHRSRVRRHPIRGCGGVRRHPLCRESEGVFVRETRREGVPASVLVTGRENRRAVLPRWSGLCGQRRGREARNGASCCCGSAIRHPRNHCRRLIHL